MYLSHMCIQQIFPEALSHTLFVIACLSSLRRLRLHNLMRHDTSQTLENIVVRLTVELILRDKILDSLES